MQGGEDGSGESKGEVKANGECFELLDKVQEFCTSQFLEDEFDRFARNHYEAFMDAAENDENWSTAGEVEHKLAYTEIYTLFLDHFEAKISGFIEDLGGTLEEFQRECRAALRQLEEYSPRRFFVDILLATTDYDRFYFLMAAEAKKLKRENDGGASSSSHK